ncbi:MAG TPA: metallopeptidase family protein [Candidatus Saccharimonadales bacterium]|nr:metallopeptidase family protein [Candidatus Saccharimonadales bacterium]
MLEISNEQFAQLIDEALDSLSSEHMQAVKNVAIVYADEPTLEQREELKLQCYETLFGLYEGVPLARRQGVTSYGPDKITIFKNPMLAHVNTLRELKEEIRHTLWHEIAHYFGLNHDQIHNLEK